MGSVGLCVLTFLATALKVVTAGSEYWCEYTQTYLEDNISGNYSYASLAEAKAACLDRLLLDDQCGGVVFDDYTERYTLRVGTELKDTERAQVAWILCGEVMCSNERHQRDYRGSLGEDEDGNKCLNWDTVVTDNELEKWQTIDKSDKGLESNYCRNPDHSPHGVWCYVKAGVKGQCNVPLCESEEDCSDEKLQKDYRGAANSSSDGLECMAWDQQAPHAHEITPELFSFSGLVGSYCRNPDNRPEGAWCFTMDPDIEWAYCGVSTCPAPCPANAARANASSECECSSGYKEWEGRCVNINECVHTEICGVNEECFDTEGSYDCVCNRCTTRGAAGGCTTHVYNIYNETMLLWAEAQLYCEEKEQMLAKINSQEDQDAFDDALNATYGFEVAARRWDNTNWVWIGATDEVTQGVYLFIDGTELTFSPPWAKNQEDAGDNWIRSKTSGTEDHLAVSRWGEWDDSFGKIFSRPFACSC